MMLFKRKIVAYKSCEKLLCCLRYTVSFDWQAKMNRVPAGFKASNGSQRVKYLHPVSILIEIRVLVTKKCLKMSIFQPCQKTFPPLVNDNEQGLSEAPLTKTDKIFEEEG